MFSLDVYTHFFLVSRPLQNWPLREVRQMLFLFPFHQWESCRSERLTFTRPMTHRDCQVCDSKCSAPVSHVAWQAHPLLQPPLSSLLGTPFLWVSLPGTIAFWSLSPLQTLAHVSRSLSWDFSSQGIILPLEVTDALIQSPASGLRSPEDHDHLCMEGQKTHRNISGI